MPPLAGDHLATFHALGHPLRWQIILQGRDEFDLSDLERTLQEPRGSVAYHVEVLARAGLLARRKHGRTVSYRLRLDNVTAAATFLPVSLPTAD